MKHAVNLAAVEAIFRSTLRDALQNFAKNPHIARGFDSQKKGAHTRAIYFHLLNPTALGGAERGWAKKGYGYRQHYRVDCYLNIVADKDPMMLAQVAHMAVRSLAFIEGLRKKGVAPLHPSEIRTIHSMDDRNNFEPECSFTLPLVFDFKIAHDVPAVDAAESIVHGI